MLVKSSPSFKKSNKRKSLLSRILQIKDLTLRTKLQTRQFLLFSAFFNFNVLFSDVKENKTSVLKYFRSILPTFYEQLLQQLSFDKNNKPKMSISSTFYARLFRTKANRTAFSSYVSAL